METQRIRPSWDRYFMKIASVVRERSPDDKTQVGAVIVDLEKRIISTGYNGTPAGFDDSFIDWFDSSKHPYILHAEANAIAFARADLRGCDLYVTLAPCSECAKLIVQHRIKKVFYDEVRDSSQFSIDFMKKCGVQCERIVLDLPEQKGDANGR